MNPEPSVRRAAICLAALALSATYLAHDGRERLEAIHGVTEERVGTAPVPPPDSTSPTGYRWEQHRLVLPVGDSYHWLLQAERMLDAGTVRVRTVEYDNVPGGREVHWAGALRWWVVGVAQAYRRVRPDVSLEIALERVAPWANTLLLAACLALLTPLIAARFGSGAGALAALGPVAVQPFFEFFVVGYLDHHGIATLCCMLAVLFLAAGGAGWVGAEGGGSDWLPGPAAARRWFAAGAVAGGGGLWISAATTVPVLAGMAIAALLAARAGGRPRSSDAARPVPSLWRLWGAVGAATSLLLYLVEYFPGNLGMRLEVNHPLYAVAWLGAGDLLARAAALLVRPAGARVPRGALPWIAADAAALLALPVTVLLTRASTFTLADPFLWTLHDRYIAEFLSLGSQLSRLEPVEIAYRASAVPLLALPLAAVLWRGAEGALHWSWRAALVLGLGAAMAYTHVVLLALTGGSQRSHFWGTCWSSACCSACPLRGPPCPRRPAPPWSWPCSLRCWCPAWPSSRCGGWGSHPRSGSARSSWPRGSSAGAAAVSSGVGAPRSPPRAWWA